MYRGKRIDNGEWVYGDKLTIGEKKIIVPAGAVINFNAEHNTCDGKPYGFGEVLQGECNGRWPVEVHPASVGQWTGLNGFDYYEGDICKLNSYEAYDSDDYEIRFNYGKWEIHSEKKVLTHELYDYYNDLEVIGNTTDNPDLTLPVT